MSVKAIAHVCHIFNAELFENMQNFWLFRLRRKRVYLHFLITYLLVRHLVPSVLGSPLKRHLSLVKSFEVIFWYN